MKDEQTQNPVVGIGTRIQIPNANAEIVVAAIHRDGVTLTIDGRREKVPFETIEKAAFGK